MCDECVVCGVIVVVFDIGLFGECDLFGVEFDECMVCIRGKCVDY